MSVNSIDSDQYVDGSIDGVHIANDAIDSQHYAATSLDAEHLGADIAGAGLAGGSGSALSVDGIVESGSSAEIKVKVFNIGDWNMDTGATKATAHGLTLANIRSVQVLIRNDADSGYYDINYSGEVYIDGTNVQMSRTAAGTFDHTDFDATSYNRGFITIWYTA
jgi:hypothetical protein